MNKWDKRSMEESKQWKKKMTETHQEGEGVREEDGRKTKRDRQRRRKKHNGREAGRVQAKGCKR